MRPIYCIAAFSIAALAQPARTPIKPVPPLGVEVPAPDRAELEAGLERLKAATGKLKGNPLLPDVLIYQEAVRFALQYNEFFKPDEIGKAKVLLQKGEERVRLRAEGQAPWRAAPGAGFSETVEFLHLKTDGPNAPTPWEKTLFHMYDATDYAVNLANTATVAYNGEIDPQKQAADAMERAMKEEGLRMIRIVGPQTPHRYHPDSKVEIDRRLDAIAALGRDPFPRRVRFVTYTLRYNRSKWIVVDGLEKHWEKAQVEATVHNQGSLRISTSNVSSLTIDYDPGGAPVELVGKAMIEIDGAKLEATGPASDRSWRLHLARTNGKWAIAIARPTGLVKRHGLQGPIDDAFMSSFLFVLPGKAPSGDAGKRIAEETQRAIREWRRQFRGEARVKKDSAVT